MNALGQHAVSSSRVRRRKLRLDVDRSAPDGAAFVTVADMATILAGAMMASAKVNEGSMRDADRVLVSLANAFDDLGRGAAGTS